MSMGTVAIGLLRFKFQKGLPKAVNSIGAASPRALETARIAPVNNAVFETGKTTQSIVRHFGTPNANDASRREVGTRRNASWEVMTKIGTMIKA